MKTLIINSNPSKSGTTTILAKKYEKFFLKKSKKNKIIFIDLYDKRNELPFLDFKNKDNKKILSKIKKFQENVKWADEIVLFFPMWNFSEPAILKNFFDLVFSSGFAFKYGNEKPIGLLKGKTAKIFITTDGPKFVYYLLLNPLKTVWNFGRFKLCGIKLEKYIYFSSIRKYKKDEKKYEIMLNKIEKYI